MVPLAMEHHPLGHRRVPENCAIFLKIYQPSITFCIHPLPEYLCIWRCFSPICNSILASLFLLALTWDKAYTTMEVSSEVQKLIFDMDLTRPYWAGTFVAQSSIIRFYFKSKLKPSITMYLSKNET